jgi:hypothetical protein
MVSKVSIFIFLHFSSSNLFGFILFSCIFMVHVTVSCCSHETCLKQVLFVLQYKINSKYCMVLYILFLQILCSFLDNAKCVVYNPLTLFLTKAEYVENSVFCQTSFRSLILIVTTLVVKRTTF